MVIQAEWNGEKWGNTKDRLRSIVSLSSTASIEEKKDADDEKSDEAASSENLDELTVSFKTAVAAGGNPRAELSELTDKIGQSDLFLLNGRAFSDIYFKLLSVSASNIVLSPRGDWLTAEISLSFKEDPEQSTTEIEIFYDGTDIAESVSVQNCTYDSYAESRADELELIFNDPSDRWDNWKPTNKAMIRVKYGNLNTGEMFIHSVQPKNESFILKAYSTPRSGKSTKSKSWEKITLKVLAQEIATKNGLDFEAFGLGDVIVYDYVIQKADESDFSFLQRRCEIDGCAFIVFEKRLCLYSEKFIDSQTPGKTVKILKSTKFDYKDDSAERVKKMKVINESFTGKATDPDVNDTDAVATERVNLSFKTQADANRTARALLRKKNKYSTSGVFYKPLLDGIAAGSIISIKTDIVKSWDGSAVVYHIRHDLLKRKSKVWIRKPLSY